MREYVNKEEESCRFFSRFCEEGYPHTLHKYKYAADFFTPKEFRKMTGGSGCTEVFRRYLSEFIASFEEEELVQGKRYILTLKPDGNFVVKGGISEEAPCLSTSERTIYHFLCFVYIAGFWQGFEKIRDLNYEPKPLVIEDFVNHIDESIDIRPYIDKAKSLGREIIIKD